jgi:hypothetical protein
MGDNSLEGRIVRTLEIMAGRGYNPTLERLSDRLLGGRVDTDELLEVVLGLDEVGMDRGFVYLPGRKWIEKCDRRVRTHDRLEPLFMNIAREYAQDYVRLCPWVRCIMVAGSVATGGLCDGDDIDLNLVVADGTKFKSFAIGTLLNRKYSLKYARTLGYARSHHYILPMFTTLNVIWEEHQVQPFIRQDDQLAYEVYSSVVLHNPGFYARMLWANPWMKERFPQMYEDHLDNAPSGDYPPTANNGGRPRALERLIRWGMFSYSKAIRMLLSRRPELLMEMDYWESLKRPYGIYDIPGREEGPFTDASGGNL